MYINRSYENDPLALIKSPADRRSIKRRHLIYYLRVWDRDRRQILGHLVDINSGGLLLISEQEIPKDQEYHLEMRWHDDQDQEHRVQFRAMSLWNKRDTNPAFVDTGFMLLDQTPDVLLPIRDLIEHFGFQD